MKQLTLTNAEISAMKKEELVNLVTELQKKASTSDVVREVLTNAENPLTMSELKEEVEKYGHTIKHSSVIYGMLKKEPVLAKNFEKSDSNGGDVKESVLEILRDVKNGEYPTASSVAEKVGGNSSYIGAIIREFKREQTLRAELIAEIKAEQK